MQLNITLKLYIEEVVILKPNIAAINPLTKGRPLVAEKITLTNARFKFSSPLISQDFSLKSFVVNNWTQNLAKTIALAKKAYNEEFFTALLDTSIDSIEYHGNKIYSETNIQNTKLISDYTIESTLLSGLNSKQIDSILVKGINSNSQIGSEASIVSSIGAYFKPLKMPSAALLAFFVEIYPKLYEFNFLYC